MTEDFDFDFDFNTQEPQSTPNVSPGELPNFVKRLNDPQREAVLATEGPLLVLAGAGSGKTRMLTSRIAHLIACKGVRPWEVLAVTFTNKAAGEMRDRVYSLLEEVGMPLHAVGVGRGPLDIGTFHAICAKILRRESGSLPFTKPFVIYDDSDQLALLKAIVKRMNIDDKVYPPKSFQYAINRLKCDAVEPSMPEYQFNKTGRGIDRKLPEVYEAYQKAMIDNNAVDFGEMITLTYRLLRDHPSVREKYQRRYRYIHVDEYQDTNRAQYLLLNQLASPELGGRGNICVVGDEDQSIYGWRGADIRNILDFEKDYGGAAVGSVTVVKLEQNYRSTQTIVESASHLISHNTQRKKKTLFSEEAVGDPIVRMMCPDDRFEAEAIIKEIKKLVQQNPEYSLLDFAVFYRTHAQSRLVEEFLRQAKLPYKIIGGLRFFDRKEIKDVMAYLRLIYNTSDSISFKRIINVPARGIGKTTLDKLDAAWGQSGSLWEFFHQTNLNGSIFTGKTAKKLQEFQRLMDDLIHHQPTLLLSDLYHRMLEVTRYVEELKLEGTDEALERIENLEEFNSVVLEFEERELRGLSDEEVQKRKPLLLGRFLEQTTLAESPETDGIESSVQLMTFHACKGLEFPVVFMLGMEEGLFPSVREGDADEATEVEEERRLCYVGMTRAREKLYMTNATFRRVWGELLYQYPARFFDEIPKQYVEVRDFSKMSSSRF